MISRRCIAFSPLALLLTQPAWAAESDLVLPLDMTGPRPRLIISIPGGATEPWVFDTGASGSVVDIERARRWGLPEEEPIEVGSPAGGVPIQGFRTTIIGARVGGVALPNFDAAAIPQNIRHAEHAGVLSPNIFSGKLVVFEFAQSRVRITDQANAPRGEGTPYSEDFPLPAINVSIAGQSFEAHIDSGAPQIVSFPFAIAASLPLAAAPEQVGTARFVDGEHALYRAQIRGVLQIGPLALTDPQIALTDGLPFVNVGAAALRRMTVTLDPERQMSWATLPS